MMTGHKCRDVVAGFGEKVWFKTTTGKTKRHTMDTEWASGYFVGIRNRTTEYRIASEGGNGDIIKCETMKRMPEGQAYNSKCIEEVSVGYREFIEKGAQTTTARMRYVDYKLEARRVEQDDAEGAPIG